MDVILSSGFLAFASHIGFLRALEEADVSVDGICGTSSGALVGALWTSDCPHMDRTRALRDRPLSKISLHLYIYRFVFPSQAVERLSEIAVDRLEDTSIPRSWCVYIRLDPADNDEGSIGTICVASARFLFVFIRGY